MQHCQKTALDIEGACTAAASMQADPGAPARKDTTRKRSYKTKEETQKRKGVTSTVVGALLFIAVVVPMLQYWGYTSERD